MKSVPEPGKPVRGSSSGRPIMALLDLVGRRWALRILWELHRAQRPLTFRELRSQCDDMSSSLLTRRLHEFGATLIVERAATGYTLTESGRQLIDHLQPLTDWAEVWAGRLGADSCQGTSVTDPRPNSEASRPGTP
ncbi:winged helix-turn-helix transcriptional regulator [Nocardia sp. CY41]|uniref:winged helix-turn-helix transcriptional regulator n=1 Tax=Nocardia sp. CY41 TaxID=2608686 RepID=UPI001F4001DA|nr:helix-turn-helix domain-containing protein [Nocardia sp. CY41]